VIGFDYSGTFIELKKPLGKVARKIAATFPQFKSEKVVVNPYRESKNLGGRLESRGEKGGGLHP